MVAASGGATVRRGMGWKGDVTPLKFSPRPWIIFTIFTNIYII